MEMLKYIESITDDTNRPFMEAVSEGYRACFESTPAADEFTRRVQSAIMALKREQPDVYLTTLRHRLANGIGSTTDITSVRDMETALMGAHWKPYSNPNIDDGVFGAVTTDIPGHLGIMPIDDVPENVPIVLADDKKTGYLSPSVKSDRTNDVGYTVLLFGPDTTDGENGRELMKTFHPGDPMARSTLQVGTDDLEDGSVISSGQARKYGFDHAKIV